MSTPKLSKVSTNFRIDENVYAKVKHISDKELRSINSQLEYFILKGVEQYEEENGQITLESDE